MIIISFSGISMQMLAIKQCLTFYESYNLKSLIKQPTCFKNPKKPSCINLFLTNRPRRFCYFHVIETGLSDFHMMTVSVMKMYYRRFPPQIINLNLCSKKFFQIETQMKKMVEYMLKSSQ